VILATLPVLLLALQGAGAPQRAPTVTARITPEAPAIGEPITVELRVRAPRGSEIRFPVLADTGTRIEPLDPRAIRDTPSGDQLDRTAIYRLIAWDTGGVDLAFSDIIVRRDGAEQRFPVRFDAVRIRSLLPRDTAQRVPRDPRAPLEVSSMPWRWWVAAAVVLGLAFWGWRRRRHRGAASGPPDPGAAVRARAAFAHLRALDLLSAGEAGRHALAHVGVARRYIGERWPALPVPLTAQELEARLPEIDFPILPERLLSLARRSEALAYAAATIAVADAERVAVDAVAVVEDLEKVYQSRLAREQLDAKKVKRRPLR
jgi:hypothetical protein